MAAKCNHCGKDLSERSKFCPSCGTPRLVTGSGGGVVASRMRVADGPDAAIDIAGTAVAEPATPARVRASRAAVVSEDVQAEFGQRLGAFLFDLLLFLILLMLATFVLSSLSNKSIVGSNVMLIAFYLIAVLLFVFNFVVLAAKAGQTIGKRLVGIRIVRLDGRPTGYRTVFLRHCVGYLLSSIVFFLGFVWVIWDAKHQGWHDKIAGTNVILE
jgi:uncharacterized RDD family membrane protein YckC